MQSRNKRRFKETEAAKIFAQIVQGVMYLHSQDVMHRTYFFIVPRLSIQLVLHNLKLPKLFSKLDRNIFKFLLDYQIEHLIQNQNSIN